MSYDLRALERWGMVERAEPRADGRERPWRATGSAVSVHTERTPDGRRASPSAAVALGCLDRLTTELDAILDRYRADRGSGKRRPGTRRTAVFLAIYPTEPSTGT